MTGDLETFKFYSSGRADFVAAEAVKAFRWIFEVRGVSPAVHFYKLCRANLFAAAALLALSGNKMRRLSKNLRGQKVNNSRHLLLQSL